MINRNDETAFPHGPMGDSMTFEDGRTNWQYPGRPGMSLRDWFAGMAMQGRLADGDGDVYSEQLIAETSYCMADAMMEAREAKQ